MNACRRTRCEPHREHAAHDEERGSIALAMRRKRRRMGFRPKTIRDDVSTNAPKKVG